MNKTEIEYVHKTITKSKSCLLGKINADIEARLPRKPEPRNNWEKYLLIKSGEAKLKRNLRVNDLIKKYGDGSIYLVDAFTYPAREEDAAYEKAVKATESEKNTRELAVELSFNRVADEHIMGLIDAKTFLDRIEALSMQQW